MEPYDVIVIGAGAAGLAAAVSARESGAARVLVLEAAPRAMRGGNTRWSGGVLRFAFDDPRELAALAPRAAESHEGFFEAIAPYPAEAYYDELTRAADGRVDPALARRLVDASRETVFWMNRACGIRMEPAAAVSALRQDDAAAWPRGLVLRAAHEGVGLSRSWFAAAERRGVEIRYGAGAAGLRLDEAGRVEGVRVRAEGGGENGGEGGGENSGENGGETLRARAVVLACGGFEADPAMRREHLGPALGAAAVRGTPHNRGDGLRMALAAGAAPAGPWSGCHVTPVSADWGPFTPRELSDRSNRLSYPYGVLLNLQGRRFVDEGADAARFTYGRVGRAILDQPGARAWQIFDARALPLLEPRYGVSEPVVADTLDALVGRLDIADRAEALRTLAAYNAAACGPEAGFAPRRPDGLATRGLTPPKSNWALRLETPPFRAYSATGGITFTFGGLKTTPEAEVVGTDRRPIPGLHACGEMVGGLFHERYPAGAGLVAGAVFGRIAGRNAAARAREAA